MHAHHPDAAIDLVVRSGNEGLFDGHPFLHRLHVWDKRTHKTRNLLALIRALRRTSYDHIINAQRFLSTGLITVLARGRETVGYDKNPLSRFFTRTVKHVIGDGRHEVDRLNALIEHLTDGTRPLPRLYPTPNAREEARAHLSTWARPVPLQRDGHTSTRSHEHMSTWPHEHMSTWPHEHMAYVCIAPASVWSTKQWPEHKWIELVQAIPMDRQVFIIGAPGDTALAQRIIAASGRGVDLTRELGLLQSAALMEGATMNYVNDSAPLHIASAMNAPVTAVFCSTVPAFGFGPLRANGRAVETTEELDCRPCGLHGHSACPKGHFRCAEGIGVERVLAP
ncbi:MAG: glycosyltransferase family 9 protein [Flavobacteriales bacterium]|nr:glycosyltransferase family 9 protein [Flavobacteriales bacterium]